MQEKMAGRNIVRFPFWADDDGGPVKAPTYTHTPPREEGKETHTATAKGISDISSYAPYMPVGDGGHYRSM